MKVEIMGREFEVAAEPADFWGWVKEGRYDKEWKILDQYLQPDDVFIDLGAWVGSHSLYASTICRRLYAFEPDPVAFKILEENVKGHPIHICRGAITNRKGTITLGSGFLGASTTRANPHEGGGMGAWVEGQTFDVECNTLRNVVAEMPSGLEIRDVNPHLFIKMDIEGGEEDVLDDFEFFAEHKPTVYIELHPFWWRRGDATWEQLNKVAALYKQPTDLRNHPRSVVLTDKEY